MCGRTENPARVTVWLGRGTVGRMGLVDTIVTNRDVHLCERPRLGGMSACHAQSRRAKDLLSGPSTLWICRVRATIPCSSLRRHRSGDRVLFDSPRSGRYVQHPPFLDYYRICATKSEICS